jgi:hypothetical protein
VTFQVLTAASMKFRFVFWDVLPCKIIVDRRFRCTRCLHHVTALMMEAARTSETSVDNYFTRYTSQKTNLNFIFAAVRTWNLTHRPDDGGSTYLWNVGRQLFYTAVHPRRQIWTLYSPPWGLEISLIALMMEAVRTSETSVDNYFTRQYIPEEKSELYIRRRENLKSHSSPWWKQYVPLKRRSTIILHGSISQKTNLYFIFAAVRTWNLTHRPDDGGSTYLWNVGRQLFYTAVHPRRQIW